MRSSEVLSPLGGLGGTVDPWGGKEREQLSLKGSYGGDCQLAGSGTCLAKMGRKGRRELEPGKT